MTSSVNSLFCSSLKILINPIAQSMVENEADRIPSSEEICDRIKSCFSDFISTQEELDDAQLSPANESLTNRSITPQKPLNLTEIKTFKPHQGSHGNVMLFESFKLLDQIDLNGLTEEKTYQLMEKAHLTGQNWMIRKILLSCSESTLSYLFCEALDLENYELLEFILEIKPELFTKASIDDQYGLGDVLEVATKYIYPGLFIKLLEVFPEEIKSLPKDGIFGIGSILKQAANSRDTQKLQLLLKKIPRESRQISASERYGLGNILYTFVASKSITMNEEDVNVFKLLINSYKDLSARCLLMGNMD